MRELPAVSHPANTGFRGLQDYIYAERLPANEGSPRMTELADVLQRFNRKDRNLLVRAVQGGEKRLTGGGTLQNALQNADRPPKNRQ